MARQVNPIILFIAFLLVQSCQNHKTDRVLRPRDPWAVRSVLDHTPRMLTLALDTECYAAYNLANCTLYKVWKGGLALQGAAYTNQKNIQPISWGMAYSDSIPNEWKVTVHGSPVAVKLSSRGYRFNNKRIYLKYILLLPSGDSVKIEEHPEYVRGKKGMPGFERTFRLADVPEGVALFLCHGQHTISPANNSTTTFTSWFNPLPHQSPPVEAELYDNKGRYWMEKSDCFSCHEPDKNTVGPSLMAIAGRYDGEESDISMLIRKIISGGGGNWGTAIMTPHPNLSESDIRPMLDYIFSLRPEEETTGATALTQPKKITVPEYIKPAFGAALEGLHPAYDLQSIHPAGFDPRVGGLAFMPDGRLLVTTWDSIGAVYALRGVETGDSSRVTVERIASGLAEPLGITVVGGEIYVLQKQELTHLIDLDGDGITDEYQPVCNTWGVTDDFHEFAFGLVYKEGYFYATLSMAMRLMSDEKELPDRGITIRIGLDGRYERINYGLRTPNGIGAGPDGEIFETDNQGEWVPSNKLIHVKKGDYHGMRWGFLDSINAPPPVAMPAVWIPEDEIGNSPSEPVLVTEGPYQGQMLHGDVTFGGIQRDFLEKVGGEYQGAVFRFTKGLEAGVNRLRFGPDGALYIGGVGMAGGGWSWKNRQSGLQRMKVNGKPFFDMLAVRATPTGFDIEFTEPVARDQHINAPNILVKQWWYLPTANYGGPKKDLEVLKIKSLSLSRDRKHLGLVIPGLKTNHEIYLSLDARIRNDRGESLWASEAWYTLNNIPDQDPQK